MLHWKKKNQFVMVSKHTFSIIVILIIIYLLVLMKESKNYY